MTEKFVKLSELKERDLVKKEVSTKGQKKYQIQGEKDSKLVKIAYVDKNTDVCLYEDNIDDFKCILLIYTLSDKDIEEKRYYMVGYLIKNKNDCPIATLNIVFCPNDGSLEKSMEGVFKIVLTNNKNEGKILRELSSYPGNESAVYLLTESLSQAFEFMEE